MKKVNLFLAALMALTMTGCSDEPKIEFEKLPAVKDDIDTALNGEYRNIEITEGITINFPDELAVYKQTGEPRREFIQNESDPKVKQTIELLYPADDFDKKKNPHDEIKSMPINIGSENETYQYINYTKDESAAIDKYGYIFLGKDCLLGREYVSRKYIYELKDNNDYLKMKENADKTLAAFVELQGGFPLKPYAYFELKSRDGETYHELCYTREIDDLQAIPYRPAAVFSGGYPTEQVWSAAPVSVFLDKDFNVCGLYSDGIWTRIKDKEVKKIPTLSSVLNYISEVVAPNFKITITNIDLMCSVNSDGNLYPVWYIEFVETSKYDKENPDPMIRDYNRIIVNCVDGVVSSSIDGHYYENEKNVE